MLVAELVCVKKQNLSALVAERISAFPSPGEINSIVEDADKAMEKILEKYSTNAVSIDKADGISLSLKDWRFN